MFEKRKFELLQRKCDELSSQVRTLSIEKQTLADRLKASDEKLASIEQLQAELHDSIKEARAARDQYEKAFDEIKVLRRRYSAEMEQLLGEMKRQ